MLGLFVFAAIIEPAFAVTPSVSMIESVAGTTAPRTTKEDVGAGLENSEESITIKLYDAFRIDWLQMVIVEITASVAAGTTYTFVCVFADGLIAPSLLKFCGIFTFLIT